MVVRESLAGASKHRCRHRSSIVNHEWFDEQRPYTAAVVADGVADPGVIDEVESAPGASEGVRSPRPGAGGVGSIKGSSDGLWQGPVTASQWAYPIA